MASITEKDTKASAGEHLMLVCGFDFGLKSDAFFWQYQAELESGYQKMAFMVHGQEASLVRDQEDVGARSFAEQGARDLRYLHVQIVHEGAWRHSKHGRTHPDHVR